MEENNKKGLVAVLAIIIVILLTLVILLATGSISFKAEDKCQDTPTNEENQESKPKTEIYLYELGDQLSTEFKIEQINQVFIATSTMKGKQCNTSDILIFSNDGTKLKEYKYGYLTIEDDIISIEYQEDEKCLSSGEGLKTAKYQVVGSTIVEK